MPEKERARLKEQYVKELRERKKIRRTLEAARRRQSTNRALNDMVDTLTSTSGTIDEFTTRLDAETALNEARLEIALEQEPPVEDTPVPDEDSPVQVAEPTAKTIGPLLKSDVPNKDG